MNLQINQLFLLLILLYGVMLNSCQFSKSTEAPKKHIITLNTDSIQPKKAIISETAIAPKVLENQAIKTDSSAQETVEKAWETAAIFQTPESTLYDKERNIIYVSNINGNPIEANNSGFISKLQTDGTIHTQQWIIGLDAPKGMAIQDSFLYVADIDKVVKIDLNKEQIIAKYKCAEAEFLNDIAIDGQTGMVYISDSGTDQIYQLKDDSTSIWLKSIVLDEPNGLYCTDSLLYIACKNKVIAVNLQTQQKTEIITGTAATDGIVKVRETILYVSDWQGEIFEVNTLLKEKKSILATKQNKINSADIGFIPSSNLLLVPTFFSNTISAYKIEKKLP